MKSYCLAACSPLPYHFPVFVCSRTALVHKNAVYKIIDAHINRKLRIIQEYHKAQGLSRLEFLPICMPFGLGFVLKIPHLLLCFVFVCS